MGIKIKLPLEKPFEIAWVVKIEGLDMEGTSQ